MDILTDLTDLIAEFDAHEAERAGKALTNADCAFYVHVADLALDALVKRLTPGQSPAEEPLSEIIAELDQADELQEAEEAEELDLLELIPAAVRDKVEAVWAAWEA